jgi:hypothetical protein
MYLASGMMGGDNRDNIEIFVVADLVRTDYVFYDIVGSGLESCHGELL